MSLCLWKKVDGTGTYSLFATKNSTPTIVAAGPIGRNAEAGASASMKSVAAIYSYSKTKGLFAGWRKTKMNRFPERLDFGDLVAQYMIKPTP